MMKLDNKQKQKISETGKKYNLKLILLHGSCASDKAKDGSDLDIAVLGRKLIEFDKLLDIYIDLSVVFGDSKKRELDLKTLHKADSLFLYQVSKSSRLLYGDKTDYSEFKCYAYKNFFDSQDLFRLERRLIYKFQNYLNKKYA